MWAVFFAFFIFVLAIIIFGVAIIAHLLCKVVGGFANLWYILTGKKPKNFGGRNRQYYRTSNTSGVYGDAASASSSTSSTESHHHQKGEKVFAADEGEYVSFEEIK